MFAGRGPGTPARFTGAAKARFAVVAGAVAVGVMLSPALAAGSSQPVSTPLPNMAAIDQVVGAQAGWAAGADGSGVGVAVIDTGVSPVAGLDAPGKLTYGPDLS